MQHAGIWWVLLVLVVPSVAQGDDGAVPLAYDEFIQDQKITAPIVYAAKGYISAQVRATGAFAVKDVSTQAERRFTIVEVFDVVSRQGDVYTVQVDADELGGEPRYLLFVDLKQIGGVWQVVGVRIGGRHLRQTSPGTPASQAATANCHGSTSGNDACRQ